MSCDGWQFFRCISLVSKICDEGVYYYVQPVPAHRCIVYASSHIKFSHKEEVRPVNIDVILKGQLPSLDMEKSFEAIHTTAEQLLDLESLFREDKPLFKPGTEISLFMKQTFIALGSYFIVNT